MRVAEVLSRVLPPSVKPLAWFVHYELTTLCEYPSAPLSSRIRLWRNGISYRAHGAYDFDTYAEDEYLSDVQNKRAAQKNGPLSVALEDKLLFSEVLSSRFGERAVETYGRICEGVYVDEDGVLESARRIVERIGEDFVLKPRRGNKGEDIYVVTAEPRLRINGRRAEDADLARLLASLDDYLVQERVEQGTYARNVYPRATNTVRAVVLIDPVDRTPHVVAAYHRFGTDRSGCVDNLSAGGISSWIDHAGELGEAISHPEYDTDSFVERHPDTDEPIAGRAVPNWESVRGELADIAMYFYKFGIVFAGWDVVIENDSGEFKVLEGNVGPGLVGLQTHKPLLTDPRVRRFLEYHDVL